jgi:hypothetical protein
VIHYTAGAPDLPPELSPERTRLRWFGSLPVQARDGAVVGVVCVFDQDPQPEEAARLDEVANLVHGLDVVGAVLGRGRARKARDAEAAGRGGRGLDRETLEADLLAEIGVMRTPESLGRVAQARPEPRRAPRAWIAVELERCASPTGRTRSRPGSCEPRARSRRLRSALPAARRDCGPCLGFLAVALIIAGRTPARRGPAIHAEIMPGRAGGADDALVAFPAAADVARFTLRARQPRWLEGGVLGAGGTALGPARRRRSLAPAGHPRRHAALPPRPYAGGRRSDAEAARLDVALTVEAGGSTPRCGSGVSPHARTALELPRDSVDLVAALDSLADLALAPGVLARAQPPFRHYRLLLQSLAFYQRVARDSTLVPLTPMPKSLRAGDRYAGAARLRALLTTLGDVPDSLATAPPVAADTVYDAGLAAAENSNGGKISRPTGRSGGRRRSASIARSGTASARSSSRSSAGAGCRTHSTRRRSS